MAKKKTAAQLAYEKGKKARSNSKVKSHYGQVSKKTQTAGKQGKKNRDKSRKQTTETVKSVGSSVKSNVTVKKTTDTKPKVTTESKQNGGSRSGAITPVNSRGTDKRNATSTARTTASNVGKTIKTNVNPHKAKTDDTNYVNGSAKGTAAGDAYNKYKQTGKALYDTGKQTVKNEPQNVIDRRVAAQQHQYLLEQEKEASKYYDKEEAKANKQGMTYGDKKEFIRRWVEDPSNKEVLDSIKKQANEDNTYTYSKSASDTNSFFMRQNASQYANNKVKTKTNQPVYETDKNGNVKFDKNGKPKVKKDKNGKTVYQEIESTQGNNILDYYGGGFNNKGRLKNQNASTEVGNQTAGALRDAKFFGGVLQGSSYGDITRGLGNYSNAAKVDLEKTKQSGAFNVGYMAGQMGQFVLGGTGKMTDALVKGVTKAGAARSALNIGLRKGGADVLFETPINTLDALKMATDADGNIDRGAFIKYMALNSGLSGGMGGVIGGVGAKMTKADAKAYITLAAKAQKGVATEEELVKLGKLQGKFDNIRQGNDVAKTDIIDRADYDAKVHEQVFAQSGNANDAVKAMNGAGTHSERMNYAATIKENADAQFEIMRAEREVLVAELKDASPERQVEIRKQLAENQQDLNRLGGIANVAERELEISEKKNRRAVRDLAETTGKMKETTGVNYKVMNDKDMRKTITEDMARRADALESELDNYTGKQRADIENEIKELRQGATDDYFYKGYYYKNAKGETEILINSESPQAHQTVIGHETGHLIKSSNSEEFGKLGGMLEEYAKKQGDYDAVVEQLRRSYPEATEDELQEEVTCELLGRYVYGKDDKFIKQLAGEQPSVIRKIIDYLKELFDGTTDKEMKAELKAIIDKTQELVSGIDKNADAKAINADYMKAAKAGDEKTAQKYVDDLAEKKFADSAVRDDDGKLVKMYHGSVDDFTTFDKNKIRESDYDAPFNGFWFSSDKRTSPAFRDAKYTKAFYLDIKNPAPHSVYNKVAKEVRETYWGKDLPERSRSFDDEVRYQLQEMGYDGVHYDGAYKFTDANVKEYNEKGITTFEGANGKLYDLAKDDDRGGYARLYPHNSRNEIINYDDAEDFLAEQQMGNPYRNNDVWVAFEPTQIKSADAITRDGERIVPLNERFDKSVDDSKFSRSRLSKREYAILRKEVVRQNANLKNADKNIINAAFTDNNFHIYETWGDDSFNVVKTIKIDGNEDLIKTVQEIIRKGLDEDETISTSELVDSIDANLRTRRKSNTGSNANLAGGQTDRRTGTMVGQEPTSNPNGNRAESGGNQSRLTKFSKEQKPTEVGSFNAFDEKIPSTDAIKSGDSEYMGFKIKYKPDGKAEAKNQGNYIEVSDKFLTLDEGGRKEVLAHEVAHNAAENIEKQYGFGELLDMEIFGKKKVAPEGSQRAGEPYYEGIFGDVTPNSLDESITDSVKYYITNPEFLKKRSPEAYDFIDKHYMEHGFTTKSPYDLPQVGSFNAKSLDQYKDAKTYDEFVDENFNILKDNYDSFGKTKYGGDEMEEVWRMKRSETLKSSAKEISEEDAADTIRGGIKESHLSGWFRNGDSAYKPRIAEQIFGSDDVLNAGWNVMYRHYKELTGSDLSFEEFLDTPITLFRGEHGQGKVSDDIFNAYSFDRNMAETHADGNADMIDELEIKPSDTWGSYQTTAEAEVLVPEYHLANAKFSKQKKPTYNYSGEKPKSKIVEKTNKLQDENDEIIKTMTTSNNADEVAEAVRASDNVEAQIEKLGSKPRRTVSEEPKEEVKEKPQTEVQKIRDSKYTSDELKTALDDIEKAGVYTEKAEAKAKKFNELDKQIGGLQKRLDNAKKKDYPTEAEKTAHIADLEDELATLRNRQKKVAGEIERMGEMPAVDNTKTAGEQIKELHGESKVNKETKAPNLVNEDKWITDKWNSIRRLWEDSLIDVENVAKGSNIDKTLREEILTAANRVRNSMNRGNFWITKGRVSFDNKTTGKALDDIFTKELIENETKYADFQEYLIMKHVPARHAKGTDIYADISPALAAKRVKELEKQYGKELTDWADDVYGYLKDLQQYRVDSGMLSKEAAERFAKDYPFYVPTNRVNDETVDFFTGGLSNGVRSAKGGSSEVLDMYSQLYTATNKTIHAAEENQMLNLYFKAKGVTDEQIKQYSKDDLEHAVINATVNKKTGSAKVSFFVDGKPVEFPCSHQLALGLRELDGLEFERLMKAAKVATLYGKPFKALVTDWNLVFGVRNGMRDFQQALVNTKDIKYFSSSMGAAAHSVAHADSPYRKLYASMGGEQAQLVSYDAVAERMGLEKGKIDRIHEIGQEIVDAEIKGKNINPIHYIEAFNGMIEMNPRMCEFIGTLRKEADRVLKNQEPKSSLKKLREQIVAEVKADKSIGVTNIPAEVENRLAERVISLVDKDTIDSAMRNANDITLNFGRSGVLGKALNMGFVPYLNPSIQGLSKLIRLFTEAGGEGGWKALASIGMKLSLFTIAPAAFNEFWYRNNEDYQNLNTRDKDNNFFISLAIFGEEFEGKFFKFPKPRENAVLAEPIEYGLRYFLGDTEYAIFDWDKLSMETDHLWEKIPLSDEGLQMFRTAVDNIGVINPATSNMVSPLWQTFHNKTWYGGSIESAYETSKNEETGKWNVPVSERKDTGTTGLAIWLGKTKGAQALNLSPKKIDNILDSYTGMIYDLGLSQTTEEAKTRGNLFLRTIASQFVKDSVFSNKLSTKAWDKIDKMTPAEQKKYKSTYMYDTFKYDDAMSFITTDKNMTNQEKMLAKRELMKKKNQLNREAIDGKPNTSNPLVDISKYIGATKTLNNFIPDTGSKEYGTWEDYWKGYKKTKGYKGLTKEQKEKESQKFLSVYALGVKGQLKVSGEFHDTPNWDMTGVAAAQLAGKGKLSKKDAKTIMMACGVYEDEIPDYNKYIEHGGNVSRFAITQKNLNKTFDKLEDWGMSTKSGLWKGSFSDMGAKGGTIAMSLATGKADFKDRAYYIANSNDEHCLDKMNAARGFAEKYGHKTKEISKLAQKADKLGDGNTYLKNDEIVKACDSMKGWSREEKAMGYVLLGGSPSKNPFGSIGNYSHDGDTGIEADTKEKSGGRRGRGHGWGHGGGGGGGKGKMPTTASGAIQGKVTDPFGGSNGTKSSNLNDAYRKKAKKLREKSRRK